MTESGGTKKLKTLVDELEAAGERGPRLQAARCTLNFKRSWIDLAAALTDVRKEGAYTNWGYADLVSYASSELGLRRNTVDKLLVSYSTLTKHAPQRLEEDLDQEMPSYQALEYFARATGEPRSDGSAPRNAPDNPPTKDVVSQLHSAVFDEGQSVRQLRQQFDPILHPRSPEEAQQIAVRRISATARRLLAQLVEVEDFDEQPPATLKRTLTELRKQTEALAQQLRDFSKAQAAKQPSRPNQATG